MPTTLGAVDAGHGIVELDGDPQDFTVTRCTTGPGEGDTPQATQEYRLQGTGKAGADQFVVVATRYRSDTGVGPPTFTEVVTLGSGTGETARGLEAKRVSVNGKWIDLNQPAADGPLLARTGDELRVDAMFGPEGSKQGDAGVVAGGLVARCP